MTFVRMHRRTSWLLVALCAYLALVLLGSYPHQHSHGHTHDHVQPPDCASPALQAVSHDECPLCAWHTAASSCAALVVPSLAPLPYALDSTIVLNALTFSTIACTRPARAPPAPRA